MAKPRSFRFSIRDGDPERLATAMRDSIAALEPLTDSEAIDLLRSLVKMYEPQRKASAKAGRRA